MEVFLKNTIFRQIALSRIMAVIGNKIYYLAMMTFVSTLPNPEIAIGLVTASELIPQMLGSYTGYQADSTTKRSRNLLLGTFIQSMIYIFVGILFLTNWEQWWILCFILIFNFMSDLIGTYNSGLILPMIVNVTTTEEYPQANGFIQATGQIVDIIAQLAGATLILYLSYSQLAWINSIFFIVSMLMLFRLFNQNPTLKHKAIQANSTNVPKGFFKSIKESLSYLQAAPAIKELVLSIVLLNAMLSSITPLIQMFIVSNENMIITNYTITIAIVTTTISVSLALGGFLGPSFLRKVSLTRLVSACLTLASVFFGILLSKNIYLSLIILMPICFLVGTIIPKLSGWIVGMVPQDRLAISVGMLNTLLVGLAPLTTFVMIMVASLVSPEVSVILFLIASMSILLIFFRHSLKEKV